MKNVVHVIPTVIYSFMDGFLCVTEHLGYASRVLTMLRVTDAQTHQLTPHNLGVRVLCSTREIWVHLPPVLQEMMRAGSWLRALCTSSPTPCTHEHPCTQNATQLRRWLVTLLHFLGKKKNPLLNSVWIGETVSIFPALGRPRAP